MDCEDIVLNFMCCAYIVMISCIGCELDHGCHIYLNIGECDIVDDLAFPLLCIKSLALDGHVIVVIIHSHGSILCKIWIYSLDIIFPKL